MCAGADWRDFICMAIESEASDIHLTVGQKPHMRCLGVLQPMHDDLLTESVMDDICSVILSDGQREKLLRDCDVDLSWEFAERRFRVNAYYQQGYPALAMRLLPERIPTLEELGAPAAWQKLKEINQGLILVTGRTGSGKSTTLAAFLEELNREKSLNMITLESPTEFLLTPKKSFISQRELGRDFFSFEQAMLGSLREMPDLVMLGEIRDAATMQTALTAASTGMLVLGTLHSASAPEAVLRIEGMFPLEQRAGIRSLLAEVLTGIISQRLVPAQSGGRLAVSEVLLAIPAVRSLIRQGKYGQLYSVMLSNQEMGMQPLGVAAQKLLQVGKISAVTYNRLCENYRGESL